VTQRRGRMSSLSGLLNNREDKITRAGTVLYDSDGEFAVQVLEVEYLSHDPRCWAQ
jgi:hypothetical protein